MIVTIVVFLLVLTVLVLIHEFGHFTMARLIGVKVEEFGLGLPPRIAGKKIGSTIYSLNWLPIGGFVRLAGEDSETEQAERNNKHREQYFWARSKKERAAILVAGVFMNFFLAVVITGFLLVHGVQEPTGYVKVVRVVDGTPAAVAGLRVNDLITQVSRATPDGVQILSMKTTDDLISLSHLYAGQPLTIRVTRGQGTPVFVTVIPRANPPKGQGPMGIAILPDLTVRHYSLAEAPGKAVLINVDRAGQMVSSLGTMVARLATLRNPQAEVAGPIGIAQVTGQAVKFGWEAVLELASIISLNLAILNILPIPALDGGRLAFVILEKILRKRVNPVFERNAHQIGMVILLILIVLVSINDIIRIAHGG